MICLLLLLVVGTLVQTEDVFRVTLNKDGGYDVIIRNQPWLRSGFTFVTANSKRFSTEDGSLKLTHSGTLTGSDTIGPWRMQAMYYKPVGAAMYFKATVKYYTKTHLLVFGQQYLSDTPVEGAKLGGKNSVSSGFPCFLVENGTQAGRGFELGYLAYGGIMAGDTNKNIGRWGKDFQFASGLDSGPLLLFDKTDDVIIVSPFSSFMSGSAQYSGPAQGGPGSVAWGLLASADKVPVDFTYETAIMFSAEGINKLMSDWGTVMRTYYQKTTDFTESDFVNNYLGYWTDNGAYYYYLTESGHNYEDTILAVKNYSEKLNIPYRYVQYDSWFYPKGPDNGVTEWDSMKQIFPHGLQYLWQKTGWPVIAHNRWWSNATVYAKRNGGKYNFVVEDNSKKALPIDQYFWDDLMTNSKKWGLVTYEQDWLNVQFDEMDATVDSLTLGRQWLHQMASGAAKSGITVQYCMSPSRHALTSLELPVVTQIRVSNDYQPGENNWKIGISSMFAHALGLAPFKDNFWTTKDQPGNVYNASEPHAELHSLVATLSTGPVGPSDKVGHSSVGLIMRSCNGDGLILKPSRPATAINKQIIQAAYSGFSGEIYTTSSVISGYEFGIILGAGLNSKVAVYPKDTGFNSTGEYQHFSRHAPGVPREFSTSSPVTLFGCTLADFCLEYTTPVITIGKTDFMILGELEKWVPMSPKRVRSISTDLESLSITLTGAVNEDVTMTIIRNIRTPGSHAFLNITCNLGQSGLAVLYLTQMNIMCNETP